MGKKNICLMEWMVPIDIPRPVRQIAYGDSILLLGSCFTEHIGHSLSDLKFRVMQNPHGILFDPASVCHALESYAADLRYEEKDLFQLNDTWHSWRHHSRYSSVSKKEAIEGINQSQAAAHQFLNEAKWVIITLGSSFSYRLTERAGGETGMPVANCHRAPAQWFQKHLMEIREIEARLENCTRELLNRYPGLQIIYTVSPVRHIRDGVIQNNRSKARLIEAVHELVSGSDRQFYFPAYELVIDVLRDYRFYDIDLVHPNYAATRFVLEHFTSTWMDESTRRIMDEVRQVITARRHRPFQPHTRQHQDFLQSHLAKAVALKEKYPFLSLDEEIAYFSRT